MKAKLFKGYQQGANGDINPYYEIFNADYDVSNEIDEFGNPLELEEELCLKGEIKSWSPFRAENKQGDCIVFFCEKCGNNSCIRPNHDKLANPYFFQGNYLCTLCGTKSTYYSTSFINKKNKAL